jgi:hypothetical protein
MAGNAWIMTGYMSESEDSGTGRIDYVLDSGGNWVDVSTNMSLINGAATYLDALFPVEEVRGIQGDFQQKYTDRDVRMERVTVTVSYPPTP